MPADGPRIDRCADVVVVGGGIVGLATARALLQRRPGLDVVVLEAAPAVAAHQSGHNSGVIHAGVYYRPGSAKARLCRVGRTQLLDRCAAAGIPHEVTGKLIVATQPDEVGRLRALAERAEANGLVVSRLGRQGVADHEPHVRAVAGLWVAATGVVDFAAVTRVLADDVRTAGGRVVLSTPVCSLREERDAVVVATPGSTWRARALVGCAGLHADHLAGMVGARHGLRTVPFRGEYYELVPDRAHLVRGLVYPVPDPDMPFLGVHLTRSIDGRVHVGPNAVLALGRHAYRWRDSSLRAVGPLLADPGVWRMARRHWRAGVTELARSLVPALLVRQAQRLVPEIRGQDLVASGAGVRAQAVTDDGRLLDDFAFAETSRTLHVLNAPSPAATASLAIGDEVARRLLARAAGGAVADGAAASD